MKANKGSDMNASISCHNHPCCVTTLSVLLKHDTKWHGVYLSTALTVNPYTDVFRLHAWHICRRSCRTCMGTNADFNLHDCWTWKI